MQDPEHAHLKLRDAGADQHRPPVPVMPTVIADTGSTAGPWAERTGTAGAAVPSATTATMTAHRARPLRRCPSLAIRLAHGRYLTVTGIWNLPSTTHWLGSVVPGRRLDVGVRVAPDRREHRLGHQLDQHLSILARILELSDRFLKRRRSDRRSFLPDERLKHLGRRRAGAVVERARGAHQQERGTGRESAAAP